jgi:hypothetical protein
MWHAGGEREAGGGRSGTCGVVLGMLLTLIMLMK